MADKNAVTIISDVNDASAVSFDVFDTLITRSLIKPRDIHFYVGVTACPKLGIELQPFQYMNLRLACEKEARERSDREDVTLDEICAVLRERLFVGEKEAEALRNAELDAERRFSVRRDAMKEVYDYAVAQGKKIFFLSDMYLPRDFIVELLRRHGYDAAAENTIVSSEEGVLKHTGNLFKRLIARAAPAEPSEILHIGDNFNADIKPARALGIRAYYCENPHEFFLALPAVARLFRVNAEGSELRMGLSLYLGLAANRLCEGVHPKKLYDPDSLFNGSAYGLGYFGLGIFMLNFCAWLKRYCLKNGVEQLAFLARDGQIIKDVYDAIAGDDPALPKSVYLYSSRRMFSIPSFRTPADLNIIFNNYFEGRVGDFVKTRLGLAEPEELKEAEKILKENPGVSFSDAVATTSSLARDVVKALENLILANAAKERDAILRYFAETLDPGRPTALVDLGYNGSIVRYYNKLTGGNAVSVNVAADAAAHEKYSYPYGQQTLGYVLGEIPFVEYNYNLRRIVPMLETCFSAKDNQAERAVIRNGRCEVLFIEDEQSKDPRRLGFVDDLRAGVTDFVKDFAAAAKDDPGLFVTNPVDASKSLTFHFNEPSFKDIAIWDGVYFENNFAGWKNKAIFSSTDKFYSLWSTNVRLTANETIKTQAAATDYDLIASFTVKEKLVFAFGGFSKARKLHNNPKQFYKDIRNPFLRLLCGIFG